MMTLIGISPKTALALAEVLAKGGYTRVYPELLKGGDEITLDKWLHTVEKGSTVPSFTELVMVNPIKS
jgi:hypothetical protein